MLKIENIKIDGGTQTREELNIDMIDQYAELMLNEIEFPAIIIFYDGSEYWLADGFHRVKASIKAGFSEIEADIKQGTRRDAILYSAGANNTHGLRRTNADKRRAVLTLLEDEEWQKWSDRKIAQQCCVGHVMVNSLRNSICSKRTDIFTDRKVERNGVIYTQDTTNIGKKNLNNKKEERDEQIQGEIPTGQPAEHFSDSIIVDIDHVLELVNEIHGTILRRFSKLNNKDYKRAIDNLIKLLEK